MSGSTSSVTVSPLEQSVLATVWLVGIVCISLPLILMLAHIGVNGNEGWNAYLSAAAVTGDALYPPPDSYLVNNYPPLSFYIIGWLGRALGVDDLIILGRIVSLGSLLVVLMNCFRMCRWGGADTPMALLGAGLFFITVCSMNSNYLAANDPQMLAFALITSGSVIFLDVADRTGRQPLRVILAVALIAAGGMVKHNLVALPLALCTWAAFHDRRRLVLVLTVAAGIGAAIAVTLWKNWGWTIVDAVLMHRRIINASRIWDRGGRPVLGLAPYVGFSLTAFLIAWRRREAHFVMAYVVWSAAVGIPMFAGEGVASNVLHDLALAASVGSIFLFTAIDAPRLPFRMVVPRPILASIVVLPMLSAATYRYVYRDFNQELGLLRMTGQYRALIDRVAEADGPVACDDLAVCYWAHKPMEIDFFNYGQRLYTKAASDAIFRERISAKYYTYIVEVEDQFTKVHKNSSGPNLPVHSRSLRSGRDNCGTSPARTRMSCRVRERDRSYVARPPAHPPEPAAGAPSPIKWKCPAAC